MHRWRIGGRDIPCQVASPQSLTPLLPAPSPYRGSRPAAITVGQRRHALENPTGQVRATHEFPGLRQHAPCTTTFIKGANRPDYERCQRGLGNPRHTLGHSSSPNCTPVRRPRQPPTETCPAVTNPRISE